MEASGDSTSLLTVPCMMTTTSLTEELFDESNTYNLQPHSEQYFIPVFFLTLFLVSYLEKLFLKSKQHDLPFLLLFAPERWQPEVLLMAHEVTPQDTANVTSFSYESGELENLCNY